MDIKNLFSSSPADAKEKQGATKAMVFGGAMVIIVIMMMMSGDDKKKDANKVGTFKLVQEEKAVKSAFLGDVKDEVYATRKDSNYMRGEAKRFKEEMEALRKQNREIMQVLKNQEKFQATNPNENFMNGTMKYPEPPRNAIAGTEANGFDSAFPQGTINTNNTNLNGGRLMQKGSVPGLNRSNVKTYSELTENDFFGSDIEITPEEIEKKNEELANVEESLNMLPSGSILKVKLLSGVDAPTLSKAQKRPLPLLMAITDLGVLPNHFKYDVDQCFVLGEGYGDLSSERVYVRTTSISCITKDGKHIDGELTGFVAGPDAKNGIRGKVVSKQGTLLARTLMSGFLSGMANGFNLQNQSISSSALGTTSGYSSVATEDIAKMGIFNGAAEGAERLADFYMDLADEITPIIELPAMVEADVIVTEFKMMDTLENNKDKKTNKPTKG